MDAPAGSCAGAPVMPCRSEEPVVRRSSSCHRPVVAGVSYLTVASTAVDVPASLVADADAVAPPTLQIAEEVLDSGGVIVTAPLPSPPPARVACLDDFDLLCVLGRGTYGRVLQVRHKASQEIFAMKVFDKHQLVKQGQVPYTRVERDIMTRVRHPFLVDLKFCFQTPTKLYLVMDFMGGGELFTHLQDKKMLREDAVRLYAAEMVLAIENLHSMDIIHRDLKPENVLLDSEGHVKLTDYGLSKMGLRDSESTRTVCGTNEYMAPEMLAGGGYGKSVDWWSLGALVFEMLVGDPPFVAKDKKKLSEKIMNERVQFPSYLTSACHSLLKGLLERNVEKRLGCAKSTMFKTKGVSELKQHAFFKGLDWRKVERREYPAPISIALSCDTDVSHFDSCFTTVPIAEGLTAPNSRFNPGTPSPPPGTVGKKGAKKAVTPKRPCGGPDVVERVPVPPFPPVAGGDILETTGDSARLPEFDTNLFRGFSFTHPDLEAYFETSDRVLYSPHAITPALAAPTPSFDLASNVGSVEAVAILESLSSASTSASASCADSTEVLTANVEPAACIPEIEEDKALVIDILAELSKVSCGNNPVSLESCQVLQSTPEPAQIDAVPGAAAHPIALGEPSPSRKLGLRADAPEFKPATPPPAPPEVFPAWSQLPVATPVMATRPVNAWQTGRLHAVSVPPIASHVPPVHLHYASGGGRGPALQAPQHRAVLPARS